MKSLLALGAAAAVLLSTPVALMAEQDASAALSADTVVARVGDDEFTMGHVLTVRRQLPEQYLQLPDEVLFQGIIDQLIDQLLLSREAPSGDDLPKSLALRLENERRALLATTVIDEIRALEVSEADLQAAYDAAFGSVAPEAEFNASHILVETEDEAKAIAEELEGGADFAELAKEKSTGPSGPNGGELGWFGKGMMVPEFETAVAALEVGAVSAPVQTQFGWHVIRLNETRDVPPPSLEETRVQLEDGIRQQAMQEKLNALRAAAGVEMLTDGIPLDAFRDDSLLPE